MTMEAIELCFGEEIEEVARTGLETKLLGFPVEKKAKNMEQNQAGETNPNQSEGVQRQRCSKTKRHDIVWSFFMEFVVFYFHFQSFTLSVYCLFLQNRHILDSSLEFKACVSRRSRAQSSDSFTLPGPCGKPLVKWTPPAWER